MTAAGLVDDAQDWPWSSFRATAGLASAPHWLSIDAVIGQFGDQIMVARRVYRDFVLDGVGAPSPWGELRGQTYLGGEGFLRDIKGLLADEAFRAWVYLLRRAFNLSLRDAALRAGVSQGRVSQIQRRMDTAAPTPPGYKVRG